MFSFASKSTTSFILSCIVCCSIAGQHNRPVDLKCDILDPAENVWPIQVAVSGMLLGDSYILEILDERLSAVVVDGLELDIIVGLC